MSALTNIGRLAGGATQKAPIRSQEFDDVYFSAVDGLAETRHVFLAGNNLPENWRGAEHFTIAETGFGTGLNFLAVWALFEETAGTDQVLEFVSFEKYPLKREQICEALGHWRAEFPKQFDLLLERYPEDKSGTHRIVLTERVILTLIFGDVNDEVPKLQAQVDCWFLDGFRPRTNPQMWTEIVFQNVARLSRPGATFATFTAVGFVKRGLKAAGYDVKRVRGFGTKWHMLTGRKL